MSIGQFGWLMIVILSFCHGVYGVFHVLISGRSMALNLSTILAPEGVTVNIVSGLEQ